MDFHLRCCWLGPCQRGVAARCGCAQPCVRPRGSQTPNSGTGREGVSQDRPGFGGLPQQSSGRWWWGILQGCNPLSNAWGGQGAPSIKATGLQLSVSPLLHNQYGGSSDLLGWPHLPELQECLPGPLYSSWGPPQRGKKPESNAVNGAWKRTKHKHPAREIRGKMMPK